MSSPADYTLAALLHADFTFQHFDNPEFASQSGNHAYAHLLQDLSPAAFARRIEHNDTTLNALANIQPHTLSTPNLRLQHKLIMDNIATETQA